jgi:hypothetical protein
MISLYTDQENLKKIIWTKNKLMNMLKQSLKKLKLRLGYNFTWGTNENID